MTRDEITKLLEITCAAYPNAKITDASGMVAVWEMTFGEYPAETIYKAVKFHIETNRFFPTVADINKCISRAEIAYNAPESSVLRLEGRGVESILPAKRDYTEEEWEGLLRFVGFGYPCDIDY